MPEVREPLCNLGLKTCTECLDSANCTSPTASLCLAGTCSPCAVNDDCSYIAGKGICKPTPADADARAETGTCVECTGVARAWRAQATQAQVTFDCKPGVSCSTGVNPNVFKFQ
jgi:hypothetical protein